MRISDWSSDVCSSDLKAVAADLGLHEHTVGKWRRRFLTERLDGLVDEPRAGRPRTIEDAQVAAVIERPLRATPDDATHWSIRSMAKESGRSEVGRVGKESVGTWKSWGSADS